MTTRVCSLLLCLLFAMLGPMLSTGEATDADHGPRADALLYELTEHAVITPEGIRDASASLQGTARPGSPLCPEGLQRYAQAFFEAIDRKIDVKVARRCSVVAVGRSLIDVEVGAGSIRGEFWVVVNSDATNRTDAQEFVIMYGTFEGSVQATSLVTIEILPGSVFKPKKVLEGFPLPPAAAFTGTFRLPFTVGHVAVYKNDRGRLVRVGFDEHALGKPTVRLEVTFD
jgi:hypothetical protein